MASRIAVIGTGGTISTPSRDALDLHEYGESSKPMQVDELLNHFAGFLLDHELIGVPWRAIDSVDMHPTMWLDLQRRISETVARDDSIVGVVVTHGTSTLEETAYFLHLTLRVQVPVVIVGAQRPAGAISSDAAINLVNALRVAASPQARATGVLVVMNNEVHSARDVTKASNFSLEAFRSTDFGPLGAIDADGHVTIYRRPVRRHAPSCEFEVSELDQLPLVEIVYSYAGASGRPISALVEEGARGIVGAGMPPGRASPAQKVELARALKSGVLIVQTSRSGSGRIVQRSSDRSCGFVAGDNLNPQKARILAMLALTRTSDQGAIERMFNEY
jgi:L-asparaginase